MPGAEVIAGQSGSLNIVAVLIYQNSSSNNLPYSSLSHLLLYTFLVAYGYCYCTWSAQSQRNKGRPHGQAAFGNEIIW